MELATKQQAHIQLAGTDTVVLAAGEKIRIQKWDAVNGITDILAEQTVPAGKAWSAGLVVDITQTDV